MANVVLCHGAWSASWAWVRLRPLMAAAGHAFFVPCLTGLGARAHLAHPLVGLDTHIHDVAGEIEAEGLADITLIGHSYGGMVATGVAAHLTPRITPRITRLIYLDAFVPQDGECLFDLLPPDDRAAKEAAALREGFGWLVPPNPIPPDTREADRTWIEARRTWQPIETLRQPLRLPAEPSCPRAYIHALRKPPTDVFARFAERARTEPGWTCAEIDASHSPNITAPDLLMETLAPLL